MKRSQQSPFWQQVKRWSFLPIVAAISALLYFGMLKFIEHDQKSFILKRVDNSGKDDLGIRPNKSIKYYDTLLNQLKAQANTLRKNQKEVPDMMNARIQRVERYRRALGAN